MFQKLTKGLMFLATVVAVPYTVALLSNIFYGWPPKKKFRRALNPRKVLALNYTCLQLIWRNLKYSPLWFRWKRHYRNMDPKFVRKNLAYGSHEQTLDLYLPQGLDPSQPRPVVVFVYGGAWSNGNKKMYSLLCSEMANRLKAVVCCPNYSLYPQGYVDDMVQDVVDCIAWLNQNVGEYGGDKDRIMLLGHSAGAHLCVMAVLELLHDELMQPSEGTSQLESLRIEFEESHFNGTQVKNSRLEINDALEESSGSTSSFVVLNDNGEKVESSNGTSAVMGKDRGVPMESGDKGEAKLEVITSGATGSKTESESKIEPKSDTELEDASIEESMVVVEEGGEEETKKDDVDDDENVEEAASDESSVETVLQNDVEREQSLAELGKSIKAVIGLAGVYDIADHYNHEMTRGIEDVSRMARAMYGEDHFDRFSPSLLFNNIVNSASLPKFVLVHGTEDHVVPLSSTTKLADVLTDKFCDITVRILPGCDHYEVCLDLMVPDRKFYEPVMSIIMETASRALKK